MAEDAPQTDGPTPNWVISPSYRVIHSNLFRYRLNTGEITLHFDTVTDSGPPGTPVAVISEASIALSWTQAKALMGTLEMVLRTIEREIGPIVMPTFTPEAAKADEERLLNVLNSVYRREA